MTGRIYIDKSTIHGKGLFATNDLSKGEIAFIAKGKLEKFIVHSKMDSLFGSNWMSISKNTWLNPTKDNPLTFLNHYCNPNLGIKGKVTFVALRYIKKGEELTVDYSILELNPLWKMKCKCGYKSCRKLIKSIKFLPEKTYKYYLPFIPRYLSIVYNREHELS